MPSSTQIFVLILTFYLAHQSANGMEEQVQRVTLSVYYESLCPYCANFIVNHLVKIFQTDLMEIVDLRLVPWGNTQIQTNNTWICQHGTDECRLNVAEACAINAWPSVQTHFKFIYCVERLHLMDRHTDWHLCFHANGLESTSLDSCFTNGVGYQLEKQYAAETENLNPRHRFVPWVVVNEYPLEEVMYAKLIEDIRCPVHAVESVSNQFGGRLALLWNLIPSFHQLKPDPVESQSTVFHYCPDEFTRWYRDLSLMCTC